MGKKSRIRIRDEHPGSYFREEKQFFGLKILQFFDANSGSGIFFESGMENSDPGSGINIPDPQL
jgi:hypothetical protein